MRPALRSLWKSYLAAERDGYRPRSLAALSELLDAVESIQDRDALARVAFPMYEQRAWDMTPREPLAAQVLRPYVREHIADPQAIWWGLQTRTVDYELLETYSQYDRLFGSGVVGACIYSVAVTGEPRWWRKLLNYRLGAVDYGTHHLDAGRGVVDGDLIDYVLLLCAAVAIVNQAPADVIDAKQREGLAELWSLLRDWTRYDDAGRPGGDFPKWTREQGSDHWVARRARTTYYWS